MRTVPAFRLGTPIGEQLAALLQVLQNKNTRGPATARFEKTFSATMGSRHSVALSTVRLGLHHALRLSGLPRGSGVLCTPLTVYPVIEAILIAGYVPVFVDILPFDMSMDLDHAAARIDPDVRVLLVTHLWGLPNRMSDIMAFARKHDLVVIEDASQCMNGTVGGRKVGTFGWAGLFSLGLTKTVSANTGAILVTDDSQLAQGMRDVTADLDPMPRRDMARCFGLAFAQMLVTSPPAQSTTVMRVVDAIRNSSVKKWLDGSGVPDQKLADELAPCTQVAFGEVQARLAEASLARVAAGDHRRREIAAKYLRRLDLLGCLAHSVEGPGALGNWWAFPTFCQRSDRLRGLLQKRSGIAALSAGINACHEMDALSDYAVPLPQASQIFREVVLLPIFSGMTDDEVESVISAVTEHSTAAAAARPVGAGNR